MRTTQREALRKSLLGIVTSSRNPQALNPLISSLAFYCFDFIPAQAALALSPRGPSSAGVQMAAALFGWWSGACPSTGQNLSLWCSLCSCCLAKGGIPCSWLCTAPASAFPASDPDFNFLHLNEINRYCCCSGESGGQQRKTSSPTYCGQIEHVLPFSVTHVLMLQCFTFCSSCCTRPRSTSTAIGVQNHRMIETFGKDLYDHQV